MFPVCGKEGFGLKRRINGSRSNVCSGPSVNKYFYMLPASDETRNTKSMR